LPEIYHRTELKKGGACIDSKIAKICGVHAGVPIEIIKDFMVHRNISTTMIYAKVKTDTLKKAGLAFDQSRVSTKCPQEGNGVKLST